VTKKKQRCNHLHTIIIAIFVTKNIPLLTVIITFLLHLLYILLLLSFSPCYAQEDSGVISYEEAKYTNLRFKALDKCGAQSRSQQNYNLKRVRGREKKFARKLQHRDAEVYSTYLEDRGVHDPIRKSSTADTNRAIAYASKCDNRKIDILNAVKTFIVPRSPSVEKISVSPHSDVYQVRGVLSYRHLISKYITPHSWHPEKIAKLRYDSCAI